MKSGEAARFKLRRGCLVPWQNTHPTQLGRVDRILNSRAVSTLFPNVLTTLLFPRLGTIRTR